MDEKQISALENLLLELQSILKEIKEAAPVTAPAPPRFDNKIFFDSIRPLFGKLTANQVQGMEAKLSVFSDKRLSHTAYALATSFHETARRMQPVREGLGVSDAWRKKNLRYYPYYGRGDVQLTWLANYEKADRELKLEGKLVANLDLALDPRVSAQVMLVGMTEGWFAGDNAGRHTLGRHLPQVEGTKAQFTAARRIINGTDKAAQIAAYALQFQDALRKAGW